MNDQLKKFSGVDFNPDKYVKEISQVCVGGIELQSHRAKIQTLAEETSQTLKKNVYKNYMQFIETAREISHLEGEMYQLSHLLSEQRALLGSMSNSGAEPVLQAGGSKAQEEKRIATLSAILEVIESCPDLLDTPGRELLHEGDLVELDPLENTALHRTRALLFSDMFLIATWISERKGLAKYKFESNYDLGSLAVVNVRDLGQVKHAFKLLVFPDTRLFQCVNNEAREEWLKKFDEAKKARLNSEQTKKKGDNEKESHIIREQLANTPERTDSVEFGSNPFGFVLDDDGDSDALPEWLTEAADDLDVSIAQRHFEEAYAIIQKTEEFFASAQDDQSLADIKSKVENRKDVLISVLLSELNVSAEKSLQGGLRASRRAVRLLNQLNKSTQACELYLKVCTNLLKAQSKRVKREGATVAYVKRLSEVYFSNLASITSEFQYRAFPHNQDCTSAFVVWVSMEVSHFLSHIIKQVFIPQTPLGTLAECIDIIRKQSQQMCELGLDLSYQVNGQTMTAVTRAVAEAGEKAVDAVKVRAAEDPWRPSRQTQQSVNKIQSELGLPVSEYLADDGVFELTANSLSFAKLLSSLTDEGLMISYQDLEYAVSKALKEVLKAHLNHLSASYSSNKFGSQRSLIQQNAKFILDQLLEAVQKKYNEKMGHRCKKLDTLRKEFNFILKESKTTITGYI